MMAADAGHLSRDAYNNAVVSFVASGFEFISLHPSNLVSTLRGSEDAPLPQSFIQVVGRLGGSKAELQSHVNVALGAIQTIWNDRNFSHTLRMAAVGATLESFMRGRPLDHFAIVFRTFVHFGADVLRDAGFLDYLQSWLRGHFLLLPSDP
jgi:hypothetical protein